MPNLTNRIAGKSSHAIKSPYGQSKYFILVAFYMYCHSKAEDIHWYLNSNQLAHSPVAYRDLKS